MSASPEAKTSSKGRIIGARALLVVGVLLTVVSILSTYVKREALDSGQFKKTSQELIASPAIQQQIAAELVDAFNSNVDLSAELEGRLPENLQALAGPLAGISGQLVDRAAQELVTRPRAQDAFVTISSEAQAQFVKVLNGDTRALETSNGNVVLDLRPLVLRLGDRFGFIEGYAAKFPPGSAQITIVKSDDLDTAQTVTHWLEQVANYVWILAIACWAGAIWLARGRRRQEVRSLGIGFAVVGVLVLLSRWAAGKYFVDTLVENDTVRPAASDAWNIITDSLAAAGWVALSVGILIAIGAWLVGPGPRATSARTSLAPVMERAEFAWGAFILAMVLIIWILPIQVFRTTVVLVVVGAIGFLVLRRQVVAELAEASPSSGAPATPEATTEATPPAPE